MDSILKTIIEQINQKNGKILFDNNVVGVEQVLNRLPRLEYIGHGIQTICFKTDKNYVVKCCMKRKGSIISSKSKFISTTHDLLSLNMPILPPIDVLYEDNTWFVYTQPMCRMIDDTHAKFCYHVLKFVEQMVKNNVRLSDIYYKNFGIYHNKIVLFDYHDIETFESSSNFLITNLYSLFTLLGQKLGWKVLDVTISHWDEIVADQFGVGRFPESFVSLLVAFRDKNQEKIIQYLNESIAYVKSNLKKRFATYDILYIGDDDTVVTDYPGKAYHSVFDLVQVSRLNNVLDIQSTNTGMGLKLAQDFPDISVTVGCGTNDEVSDTRYIMKNCLIYNATVVYGNILEFKPPSTDKYDLVLYHTIIFDLLQTKKLCDLFQFVKNQVRRYFVLEIPVKGDSLLTRIVKSHKKLNWECLSTPYAFRNYLCANKIKVNRFSQIEYNSKQLKRFLFICSVET
jgi:hypothetical protein